MFKIASMAEEGSEVVKGEAVLGFDSTELERQLKTVETENEEFSKKIEKEILDNNRKARDRTLARSEADARLRKARLVAAMPEELGKATELEKLRLHLRQAEMEVDWLHEKEEAETRAGQAAVAILQSQKDHAAQRVSRLRSSIERMTVLAPRDGTVIYATDWEGNKKKIGDSCWRGVDVVELPDLSSLKGVGFVAEADAGKVRTGQAVRIILDAHPDIVYRGTVDTIWQTVERKNWRTRLKVFRLDLSLEETDGRKMKPGMRFTGNIETGRLEDALLLPVTAVFPSGDGPVVYRKTWLGFERIAVEPGKRNESRIQILSGLAPGDRVANKNLGLESEP
jgi:multidrug efflux pump subunit AcrA (membrane-fusion protein)